MPIGKDILEKTIEEGSRYMVHFDPEKPVNITLKEHEQFIGLSFLLSCFWLLQSKIYWQTEVGTSGSGTLTCNGWEEIKFELHFSVNIDQ
jgi:hypothetical protein